MRKHMCPLHTHVHSPLHCSHTSDIHRKTHNQYQVCCGQTAERKLSTSLARVHTRYLRTTQVRLQLCLSNACFVGKVCSPLWSCNLILFAPFWPFTTAVLLLWPILAISGAAYSLFTPSLASLRLFFFLGCSHPFGPVLGCIFIILAHVGQVPAIFFLKVHHFSELSQTQPSKILFRSGLGQAMFTFPP